MDEPPPGRQCGPSDDAHEDPATPVSKRLNVGSDADVEKVEKATEQQQPSLVTGFQAASKQEHMDFADAASPSQMEHDGGSLGADCSPQEGRLANESPYRTAEYRSPGAVAWADADAQRDRAGRGKRGTPDHHGKGLHSPGKAGGRGATPADNRGPNREWWQKEEQKRPVESWQEHKSATPADNRGPNREWWHKEEQKRPVESWQEHKKRCLTMSAKEKCTYGLVTLADIKPYPWRDAASGIAQVLRSKVVLWKGDITKLGVDAIVNAANRRLLGGGGVDGAIHAAAGKWLVEECRELNGCETGGAKITGGYRLPAKHVIHTVGPTDGNSEKLESCYEQCLRLVSEHKLKSVAFPCIATGIYGFPNRDAARIALKVTCDWLKRHHEQVEKIVFCVFLPEDFSIYTTLLPEFFPPSLPVDHAAQAEPLSGSFATGRHDGSTAARSVVSVASQDRGAIAHAEQELPGGVISKTLLLADDVPCQNEPGITEAAVANDESEKTDKSEGDAGDGESQKKEPGITSDAGNDESQTKESGGASDADNGESGKKQPAVALDVGNDGNPKESGGASDAVDDMNRKEEPEGAADACDVENQKKESGGSLDVSNNENPRSKSGGAEDAVC